MSDWDRAAFRRRYVAAGGCEASARSYIRYLNRVETLTGPLAVAVADEGGTALVERVERMPLAVWGEPRHCRDGLSALRKFIALLEAESPAPAPMEPVAPVMMSRFDQQQIMALLAEAQALGGRYRRLTGKPLRVTGEVAELEAARHLDLHLCAARTPWFDAIDPRSAARVQIKGRAVNRRDRYVGMMPAIRCGDAVDEVALVLLDQDTLLAIEIWTAPMSAVAERVASLSSERRRRKGVLGISQFKTVAICRWSDDR